MLQFILGRASSGKSYEICRRIAECVKRGKNPVLIIPEQFSFESEKRLLSLLGDADMQKVKVLSFSRLCDEVESITGGMRGEISDSDKIILINTALKRTRDKLKYFGKYSLSSGLAKMMLSTIGEFSQNAVGVSDIFEVSESIEDGILGRKLYDTAIVYAEYNDLLAEKFEGYSDRLDNLYKSLLAFDYFADKQVFIDSFGGFTGQQYKIIERILVTAQNTTVSFCDNPSEKGSLGIFSNIKKAKNRISVLADKHKIETAPDFILQSGRFTSPGISAVEEYMCLGKSELGVTGGELQICSAQTAYDEAQFVARNIRRIVRNTGARWNEFVVIARNSADYEQVLTTAFEKNGINFFMDKRLPLSSLPPAAAARAAMEFLGGITTEKIFRFHKCGVGFLNENELSLLENYVYIWGIDGDSWQQEWTMDPRGLDKKGASDEKAQETLSTVNSLRIKAIAPINEFKKKFGGSSRNMAKAVVDLLESAKDEFLNISENYKNSENSVFSDGIVAAYSKVMKILDSIVNCLPAEPSSREFADIFKNCVDAESVGVIPQMVDQVLFGSAERIQPSRPSYVFIMGANQSVFPKAPEADGIFAVSEIGKLISLGIQIPDCSVYSAVDEDLLVYNSVCCADKGVFISFNQSGGKDASYFVKRLSEYFSVDILKEPDNLCENNLPETAQDAFSRLCRSERESTDYETIKTALLKTDGYSERVSFLGTNFKRPNFDISGELARRLVGNNIGLSPSRFDTYNRCAFMYFCRYVLSVKSIEAVDFSAMQTGTLIHFVLEKFVMWARDNINTAEKVEIHKKIDEYINEYLDSIKGYREVETPHLRLMIANMTETLKYLGERLISEFRQSDFKPEKCELIIGKGGDIPALKLSADEQTTVTVSGAVDRLDRYGGYLRIIDYKTGRRDFKLPDILVGQNMQMLIYLYAVCKDENIGGSPAGIFYMRAALPDDSKATSRSMNGFMPEVPELINAMDKSASGEYIKQSSPKARLQGVTEDDFDEIFSFLEMKLKQTGLKIANGKFSANPIDGRDKAACEYCEFASICRIEKEKPPKAENFKKDEIITEIKRQVEENGG